jgi:hypothetical protein
MRPRARAAWRSFFHHGLDEVRAMAEEMYEDLVNPPRWRTQPPRWRLDRLCDLLNQLRRGADVAFGEGEKPDGQEDERHDKQPDGRGPAG